MTTHESSDVPMSAADPRFWLRLALGLLVMAAALFGLAVLGWLYLSLTIGHWAIAIWMTPRGIVGLVADGVIFGLPILMIFLFVGAIAFSIGDSILGKGQPKGAQGREVRS